MKKFLKIFSLSLVFVLSSCEFEIKGNFSSSNGNNSSSNNSVNVNSSSKSSSSISSSSKSSSSSKVSSSSSSSSAPIVNSDSFENEEVTIYAVNDVHGKIKATTNYVGLVGLQGAIKNDNRYNDESFIISSGDMWQGSYLSGNDKGLSTTLLLNSFGIKSMTLGNHEFDWGIDQIKTNMAQANFPLLCANLIDSNGNKASWVQDYTIVDVGTNYKVGIVGLIDKVESSIKTTRLEGYTFSSNLSYVYDAVNNCKKDGADAVILSIHGDQDATYVNQIQKQTDLDVVGIFGGHSHSFEKENISSDVHIPYVQGGCDSNGYSYITINKRTNKLKELGNVTLSASTSSTYQTYADKEFATKVNEYIASVPEQVVGYIKGSWSKDQTANLVLKAMAEACKIQFPEKNYSTSNLLAIHNTAGIRGKFPGNSSTTTTITMEDVQVVSPFDNTVVLLRGNTVSTSQIKNHYTYPDSSSVKDKSTNYDIVVIDYLISNPSYNYGTYDTSNQVNLIDPESDENYIIFDVVANYITRNSSQSNPIKSSDYNS